MNNLKIDAFIKLSIIVFFLVFVIILIILFIKKKYKYMFNQIFCFLGCSFMLIFTSIKFGPSCIKQLYDVYSNNFATEEGIITIIDDSPVEKGGYNIYIKGEEYVLIPRNITCNLVEGDLVRIEYGKCSMAIIKIEKI